jgi:MFS family permease
LVGAWAATTSPKQAKGAAFGLMGAASSLGFGSGPLLGGAIVAATGIRPLFAISAAAIVVLPLALLGLVLVVSRLFGHVPERAAIPTA